MKEKTDSSRWKQQSSGRDESSSRLLTDGGSRDDDRSQHWQNDRQPRNGQQDRQPPRGQQDRQPPQGQQGRQPPQGQQGRQPPEGPQGGQPPDSGDGISRRQLLAGGAGAAVAASAGGWYFFLRGPSGAKAVAEDYVSAVAENDWATIEGLFHEESEIINRIESSDNIDNYEQLLENDGRLSRFEELSPSVKNHIEFAHYPDFNEQTAEDIGFNLPGAEMASSIDEVKRIITVIEVNIDAAYDEERGQSEHLAGETTTEAANSVVVSSEGKWSLWSAFL